MKKDVSQINELAKAKIRSDKTFSEAADEWFASPDYLKLEMRSLLQRLRERVGQEEADRFVEGLTKLVF